jgi:hypothetical protein
VGHFENMRVFGKVVESGSFADTRRGSVLRPAGCATQRHHHRRLAPRHRHARFSWHKASDAPSRKRGDVAWAALGTTAKHERTTHDRNNLVWRPREAAERTAMNAAGTQTVGAGSMDPPKGPEEPRPFVARYATPADAATMRGAHRCRTSAPGSRPRPLRLALSTCNGSNCAPYAR